MPFTFLHSSDWHIGKPFGSLPEERASVLRNARLEAIGTLADATRTAGAAHVLVGGDVFDRPSLPDRDLRAPIGRMRAHSDLVWHVIPGNHDPSSHGGVWDRASRDGLPPNVRLHLAAAPVEIAEGVWLLPAPLATRSMLRDPTEWMDGAPTPEGALRIGLAHGSIQGFGSERTASITIAPDRPRRAGLDYLALGDWHGARRIGPRIWYSGTPEPDAFLDNEPGQALAVTIDGPGRDPRIEKRTIGSFRWMSRDLDVSRPTDLDGLEREIATMGPDAAKLVLAVAAVGRTTIDGERALRAALARIEEGVFHLDRRLDDLGIAVGSGDLERFGDSALGDIARDLAVRAAATDDSPERATAERAMRHLFEIDDAIETAGSGETRGRPA